MIYVGKTLTTNNSMNNQQCNILVPTYISLRKYTYSILNAILINSIRLFESNYTFTRPATN